MYQFSGHHIVPRDIPLRYNRFLSHKDPMELQRTPSFTKQTKKKSQRSKPLAILILSNFSICLIYTVFCCFINLGFVILVFLGCILLMHQLSYKQLSLHKNLYYRYFQCNILISQGIIDSKRKKNHMPMHQQLPQK